MTTIDPEKPAYYIKLGGRGEWERECLRNGNPDGCLRLGYQNTPFEACINGRWDEVLSHFMAKNDRGTSQRYTTQIRAFFEAQSDQVFITFHDRKLWWCQPTGPVVLEDDGTHFRATVDGWHDCSIGGTLLGMDRLSGKLLKTEGFRGTICKVGAHEYLIRKLHDEISPDLNAAELAEEALCAAILTLISNLSWQDFECLVELVFSASGWRRVSSVGKTQKTIDLDMTLPTTGERAFVQIKSQTNDRQLNDYISALTDSGTYSRMFFVWHTGKVNEGNVPDGVTLIGPRRLAKMVVDAGLSSWVRDKAG